MRLTAGLEIAGFRLHQIGLARLFRRREFNGGGAFQFGPQAGDLKVEAVDADLQFLAVHGHRRQVQL